MSTNNELQDAIDRIPLFDHHCHGVVTDTLTREEFEALISESSSAATPGTTRFDSQIGFQVRNLCAPVLGLDPFASPDDYIAARAELESEEVNKRFIRRTGIAEFGVETGHAADTITDPDAFRRTSGGTVYEIVRLERVAEQVAEAVRDSEAVGDKATEFLTQLGVTLDEHLVTAAGVKSIAAYRTGLDFDADRPSEQEVLAAAERFVRTSGKLRLEDSTLIRHLLWFAIDRAQVIQLHIGYGDDDVDLHRCNPLLLTNLFRASLESGARFTLLHCYPFHREAGYLADVFPHVYFDVGLAINYTGARSRAVIAESLELAPFGKILFSTDAFGLPELYYIGTLLFREGLLSVLEEFHKHNGWPIDECIRVAQMIGFENAQRLYGVSTTSSNEKEPS